MYEAPYWILTLCREEEERKRREEEERRWELVRIREEICRREEEERQRIEDERIRREEEERRLRKEEKKRIREEEERLRQEERTRLAEEENQRCEEQGRKIREDEERLRLELEEQMWEAEEERIRIEEEKRRIAEETEQRLEAEFMVLQGEEAERRAEEERLLEESLRKEEELLQEIRWEKERIREQEYLDSPYPLDTQQRQLQAEIQHLQQLQHNIESELKRDLRQLHRRSLVQRQQNQLQIYQHQTQQLQQQLENEQNPLYQRCQHYERMPPGARGLTSKTYQIPPKPAGNIFKQRPPGSQPQDMQQQEFIFRRFVLQSQQQQQHMLLRMKYQLYLQEQEQGQLERSQTQQPAQPQLEIVDSRLKYQALTRQHTQDTKKSREPLTIPELPTLRDQIPPKPKKLKKLPKPPAIPEAISDPQLLPKKSPGIPRKATAPGRLVQSSKPVESLISESSELSRDFSSPSMPAPAPPQLPRVHREDEIKVFNFNSRRTPKVMSSFARSFTDHQ